MSKVRVAGFGVSWMASVRVRNKAWKAHLGCAVPKSFNGSFIRKPFARCTTRKADPWIWTMSSRTGRWITLAPSSSAAICSAPSAALARRLVEGVVGRQSRLSRANVRAHAPRARASRHAGRNHLLLHHRRHRRSSASRQTRGRRQRHQDWRRRFYGTPVSAGWLDRFPASRNRARLPGPGEALFAGLDLPDLGYSVTSRKSPKRRLTSCLRRDSLEPEISRQDNARGLLKKMLQAISQPRR